MKIKRDYGITRGCRRIGEVGAGGGAAVPDTPAPWNKAHAVPNRNVTKIFDRTAKL